jgi:hypothetical protein
MPCTFACVQCIHLSTPAEFLIAPVSPTSPLPLSPHHTNTYTLQNHRYSFMRRNVRRLNREVGGVVVAVTATNKAKGMGSAAGPETGEFDFEDGSKKPRVNVTKKAANLSELKRYCKAAEEAAREVLIEAQNESGAAANNPEIAAAVEATNMDVHTLANLEDTLPLKSPSRMVALQLANGNPNFRERLKKKLEESGVTFEMDDAAGVLVGFGT